MEKYIFKIDKEHAGRRIDSVLSDYLEDSSRSFIQKLIEQGKVCSGGKALAKNAKLADGSAIELIMPDPVPLEAVPEEMPLDIRYEDDHLIVVNKPKGLVVHPAAGNLTGTLVNGILYHCSLSTINGVERPGIVHRIDKDTSGLLVIAKTDEAHRGLAAQFEEHSITRIYRGVVSGRLKEDHGTVDAPIGRDPGNRLRMAVVQDGRRAVTHWSVREYFKDFTEIEAKLETGRTHQIRVHMASMHHPLLGDTVYGAEKQPYKLCGQMLHAGTLGFVHPVTGEYLEFHSDPPEEYNEIIERLRNRT